MMQGAKNDAIEEMIINSGLWNPHSSILGLLFKPNRIGTPTAAATNQHVAMYSIVCLCLSALLCCEYSNGRRTALYLYQKKEG